MNRVGRLDDKFRINNGISATVREHQLSESEDQKPERGAEYPPDKTSEQKVRRISIVRLTSPLIVRAAMTPRNTEEET